MDEELELKSLVWSLAHVKGRGGFEPCHGFRIHIPSSLLNLLRAACCLHRAQWRGWAGLQNSSAVQFLWAELEARLRFAAPVHCGFGTPFQLSGLVEPSFSHALMAS